MVHTIIILATTSTRTTDFATHIKVTIIDTTIAITAGNISGFVIAGNALRIVAITSPRIVIGTIGSSIDRLVWGEV